MKPKNVNDHKLLEQYRADVSRCVKCGACRAVCPPFLSERGESSSARGRMALVQAVLDGQLAVSAVFKDRLATCTGCLACEASCPSGVPVTAIIQAAKEQAIAESGTGIINRLIAGVVKHPAAFRASQWLAPVALRYSRIAECGMRNAEFRIRNEKPKTRDSKGTVVFFPGCAVDYFQPEIGKATIGVLNSIGYDVIVPGGLKCCGRPLLSLGDRGAAEELAAHNTALLDAINADAIVTACASCGLTFKKEYPKLLRSGAKAPAILDIHEFLAGRISGLKLGPVKKLVTWHDPCHLGRGQGLSGTARDILRAVPGLALEEMRNADRCCGFGGVMRITHHKLSNGIAGEKAGNIMATKAEAVVTGCPGCRMQIANALSQAGSRIEVLHTVQILEEALLNAECGIRIAELEHVERTR
jgi:glycolate oxidase iron-sulfur subunit